MLTNFLATLKTGPTGQPDERRAGPPSEWRLSWDAEAPRSATGWRQVGSNWFVSGRPVLRGIGGCPNETQLDQLLEPKHATDAYLQLSGMFLLLHRSAQTLTVVTDRFSHLPVYTLQCSGGRHVASSAQRVAKAADVMPEIDRVSVAELLLWDNITFPHTTRVGVTQLSPGSVHAFTADGEHHETSLWRPEECEKWPGLGASVDRAVAAAEEAAREIASQASSATVLFSGGLDSRVIAAALKPVMQVRAVTYMDRPNQETQAAAQASAKLGIEHVLVRRDPEFYASAFELGQQLAGFEQCSMPCHAATLKGSPSEQEAGVFVSGFGCDILLKGAYIPYGLDTVIKSHHFGTAPGPKRIGKHNYGNFDKRKALLKPQFVDAALKRRKNYEDHLRTFRPRSAEEWIGFYPISHTTSIDTMVAARLLPYDEFFFHAGFVDAMAQTPWLHKKSLKLVSRLATRLDPSGAVRLKHPQTGLPATTPLLRRRLMTRLGLNRPLPPIAPQSADPSWYSQSSFVNYSAYVSDSPAWRAIRDKAFAQAPAVQTLGEIMSIDPRLFAEDDAQHAPAQDALLHVSMVQALRLFGMEHADFTESNNDE